MFRSVQTIVCRVTNRLFVGLPLCKGFRYLSSRPFFTSVVLGRDPDWIDLNIQYALCVSKGSLILRLFPTLLKPCVAFTQMSEIRFPTCWQIGRSVVYEGSSKQGARKEARWPYN